MTWRRGSERRSECRRANLANYGGRTPLTSLQLVARAWYLDVARDCK